MINRHLLYLKSWRLTKKSKYNKDIKKVINDIDMIIESKYSSLNDIKKIYAQLFSCNYFIKFQRIYEDEELKKLNIDINLNEEELDELQDQMYDVVIKNCNENISLIIINFLKKIKIKFNELPEQIIINTIDNYNIINYETQICEYLREINYKIKTKKILEIFMKRLRCDFYDLIEFDSIELTDDSINKFIMSFEKNNFKDLDKFFNKINNLNKDKLGDELIKIIINDNHYDIEFIGNSIENIFNWVINNLDIKYALQILQCIPLIIFYEEKYIGNFYVNYDDDNDDNDNGEDDINTDRHICNVISNLKNKIDEKIKIYFDKIVDVYTNNIKITIKEFDNLDILISQKLHNICFPIIYDDKKDKKNKIRRYRQIKKSNIIEENNIDDNTFYYLRLCDRNILGKTLKLLYKTIRTPVLNILIKNMVKEQNISELVDINIFKNEYSLLTLDEKINLFETIFNGKITNKNLIDMIFYNNELAIYIINNINTIHVTDDMIKASFKSSNVTFINKLIEMKYNMKTSYLNYILENKNIEQILKVINKYNTLEFDDDTDWILHISYLNNSIDIGKCFYNEYNEDLINKMNQNVENVRKTPNLMMLNNLEFKDFISHVNRYINVFKIKLKINDIIKLKDFNKRQYLVSLL